jgi:hypothetical protein
MELAIHLDLPISVGRAAKTAYSKPSHVFQLYVRFMTEGRILVVPSTPVGICDQPWMQDKAIWTMLSVLPREFEPSLFLEAVSPGSLDYCVVN